jgi:ABC-type sugar transport system, periplasmic component
MRRILKAGLAFAALGLGAAVAFAQQPYQLTWYSIGTPQKDTAQVFDKVNEYVEPKIGVHVNFTQLDWGEYTDKMRVIQASGQPFDICFTCSWANNYEQNAQAGAFLAIDDLLKTEGKDLYKAEAPSFWKAAKVKGKIYGVPVNKEAGQGEYWIFNKSLLDKYGLKVKDGMSLKDIMPLMSVIKKSEPKVTVLKITKLWYSFIPYDLVIGDINVPVALWMDKAGTKVFDLYESKEWKDELATVRECYQKGYIPPEAAIINEKESYDSDSNQDWFVTRASGFPGADSTWENQWKMKLVCKPVNAKAYINTFAAIGAMQAISVTSKNPSKAMAFLNLLNTDPYLRNLVSFGIEGVHYTKSGPNAIGFTDKHGDYNMPDFSFGNRMIDYVFTGDDPNKWKNLDAWNRAGIESKALGFIFDQAPVRTEIAAIMNVSDQYRSGINTGTVDPAKMVPEYVAKMNAAGLPKVIAEVQRQFDAFLASQK